ncbi:hypothetical protein PAXRUDRAFT_824032 [Paxillus rubicundulus Ve08.2h10]|uniref:DNA polymerase lambda n=1 Tax=Paxillus rubicundulus Ve08.2h10 TaxID=930991 RepID=A0A0D0EBV6_9AGAM|nr:hypothetical protein PAXRUDRAFT_824032 [Paxillus rubicundulus Ve08.2h10]
MFPPDASVHPHNHRCTTPRFRALVMNGTDAFFAEQERRMNLPDEDVDEYIRTRLEALRKDSGAQARTSKGSPGRDQTRDHLLAVPRKGHSISNLPRHDAIGMATSSGSPLNLPSQSKRRSLEPEITRQDKSAKIARTDKVPRLVAPDSSLVPPSSKLHVRLLGNVPRDRNFSNPNITARATRSQNSSACVDLTPEDFPVRVVATTRQRRVPGLDARNNVSNSTDPDLESDQTLPSSFQSSPHPQMAAQTPGVAMPVPKEASRSSNHTIRDPRLKNSNKAVSTIPPITAIDNGTVIDASPSPSSAPHSNVAISSSIPIFYDHGQDTVEFAMHPDLPSHLSPPGLSSQLLSIPANRPEPVVLPSSRPSDHLHGGNSRRERVAFSTGPGLDSATDQDVSNITSFSDTPSREPNRHVRVGSDVSDVDAPSSMRPPDPKESKLRRTVSGARQNKGSSSTAKGGKKAKEKPQLVTPLEYAQKLQSSFRPPLVRKANYLKGKRIFYVGGDMKYASIKTRGRMDYIVKHGGTLVPKYDPALVTHIVTDTTARPTLRALSLKSLSEIPDHIPTVTWNWVISGYGRANKGRGRTTEDANDKGKAKASDKDDERDDESAALDFEFLHAAFAERIDAGRSWQRTSAPQENQDEILDYSIQATSANLAYDGKDDVSRISYFTPDNKAREVTSERGGPSLTVLPPPPLDLKPSDGHKRTRHAPLVPSEDRGTKPSSVSVRKDAEDPLAEYYALARAERDDLSNQDESDSDGGEEGFEGRRGPAPRKGFTCDRREPQLSSCPNQDMVDKLQELMELHRAKPTEDDNWRVFSYSKCIRALRNYPKPIRSFSQACSIRGVGEKTARKIMEIIETGSLRRIKYEKTEDVEATKLFQGIYGVGRQTAFAWFASGLRNLDDVRARKGGLKLTTVQEIGLKFYDDINSRMPREEAKRIFEIIQPIALSLDGGLFIEIMGSFRRGKADCGDIDILITRPTINGKTHQGILPRLLERLHSAKILTEDLAIPNNFQDLELVYRGLCKLPEPGAKRRRIDILCVPWESKGAALLYYTGDDIFNRAMRLKAKVLGYSLNQRGLYAGVVRDPHDQQVKVCDGNIIASETEEEIFKILGVPWQEPHERVRG